MSNPTPKGKLQRFILTALTPKNGKTRQEIEAEYTEHTGTVKAPGTFQALRQLLNKGLITFEITRPNGQQGRSPHAYTLTDAGVEAKKAVRKQDRAS